jgi:hypothetical protein
MPTPLSFDDLIKRRQPLRDINKEIAENIGLLERMAVWITERVGTMGRFAGATRNLLVRSGPVQRMIKKARLGQAGETDAAAFLSTRFRRVDGSKRLRLLGVPPLSWSASPHYLAGPHTSGRSLPPRRHALEHAVASDQAAEKRRAEMSEERGEQQGEGCPAQVDNNPQHPERRGQQFAGGWGNPRHAPSAHTERPMPR